MYESAPCQEKGFAFVFRILKSAGAVFGVGAGRPACVSMKCFTLAAGLFSAFAFLLVR
jgi:hypothetical protein